MQTTESGPVIHDFLQLLQTSFLNGQMSISTRTENDHGIRTIQGFGIIWPTTGMDLDIHTFDVLQAVFNQHAPGLMFVLKHAMGGWSGNEHNLFYIGMESGHQGGAHDSSQKEG
jgi:hypothetical protein